MITIFIEKDLTVWRIISQILGESKPLDALQNPKKKASYLKYSFKKKTNVLHLVGLTILDPKIEN